MLAAFLTFVALVLAFAEKSHLFEKPVTRFKVMFITLLVMSAGISGYKGCADDIQQDHSAKVIDSLSGGNKALLIQIDTLKKENRDAQKECEAGQINTIKMLAEYGYMVDSMNRNLVSLKGSIQTETPPTLMLVGNPEFDSINKERVINYAIRATGANAHLLGYYYVILNTHNLTPGAVYRKKTFFDKPQILEGSTNYTTIIPTNEPNGRSIFFDRHKRDNFVTDTFVLAMEFVYKSKGNKLQTPVRKVYIGYQSTGNIDEVSSYMFTEIALVLKKERIWPKFYDL